MSSTLVSPSDSHSALVVGATGIGGSALVDLLTEHGWPVTALSRRPIAERTGVTPLAADLRSDADLARVLADERPSHVFFTAWSRQATEEENIAVNGGMVRDLLAALAHAPVEHVALVTGLKHYLGPFETYGQGAMPDTPFHEEEERLDAPNFYYAQEDELFAAAERAGFTWSVHRSHTMIGHAVGNAMNMGLTLAVAASIHRAEGAPFVFPGSLAQWNGLTDVTDATILAEQMLWAATSEAGRDEPFNVVNGDVFRWRWMWARIAEYFDVEPIGPGEEPQPLEQQMAEAGATWQRLVREHGLIEPDLARVASWWHTDADLGRRIEVVTDIGKSRLAGFDSYHRTVDSFIALFERYRAERLIP